MARGRTVLGIVVSTGHKGPENPFGKGGISGVIDRRGPWLDRETHLQRFRLRRPRFIGCVILHAQAVIEG